METISSTNVWTAGLPLRQGDHWFKGPSVPKMFPTCLHSHLWIKSVQWLCCLSRYLSVSQNHWLCAYFTMISLRNGILFLDTRVNTAMCLVHYMYQEHVFWNCHQLEICIISELSIYFSSGLGDLYFCNNLMVEKKIDLPQCEFHLYL